MNKSSLLILLSIILLSSCATTKQISYFQDVVYNEAIAIDSAQYITVRPRDMISIVVSSKDPELAALFNLPRIQNTVGQPSLQMYNSNNGISGYTIDSKGNIDFPVLGRIHIAGMTREQISETIKSKLIDENLIKDPVVTVDFMNLTFSLLGEVNKPGLFNINKDQITILEAISMAGDLTVFGQRDKVMVTRIENGQRTMHLIDLRSTKAFDSPVFYLRQNDVVYVEPNLVKANQSTVNGNNVKSVSLWISIASFLTTLSMLIFK